MHGTGTSVFYEQARHFTSWEVRCLFSFTHIILKPVYAVCYIVKRGEGQTGVLLPLKREMERRLKMVLEIIGYIGSALVVVSMLMSSIVKLRVINTVGSVISMAYAIAVGAFPLALMNICLIVINVYNLIKLLRNKKVYELVKGTPDDSLVEYFLQHYKNDIEIYFPQFEKAVSKNSKAAYTVCCEGNPAGVLLGNRKADTLDIVIEYTTPVYRDCSVGSYLYQELASLGIRKLRFAQPLADGHKTYLQKMGYQQNQKEWIRTL